MAAAALGASYLYFKLKTTVTVEGAEGRPAVFLIHAQVEVLVDGQAALGHPMDLGVRLLAGRRRRPAGAPASVLFFMIGVALRLLLRLLRFRAFPGLLEGREDVVDALVRGAGRGRGRGVGR